MKKVALLLLVIFLVISTNIVSAQDPTPVAPDQVSSGTVTIPLYGILLLFGCPTALILFWLCVSTGLIKRDNFFEILGVVIGAVLEGLAEGIVDSLD